MNLNFNTDFTLNYSNNSQVARVLTETWVADNMYCPRCGNLNINHFPNNTPVADFYCPMCKSEYELKSKNGSLAHKVNDGAYETMINRITSNHNPDFFFMNYCKEEQCVKDFIFVPKHFFVPDVIEKRKPLAKTARRAGWIGCNILLCQIPEQGRINIIKNGEEIDRAEVVQRVAKSKRLEINEIHTRGWVFDVLNCINQIPSEVFSLEEVYFFVDMLSKKHPKNNNVEAKIRQQLQVLRDLGVVEFSGRGKYRKIIFD